jgi:hypothetical protein
MKYWDSELNAWGSRTFIDTVHIAAAVIGWKVEKVTWKLLHSYNRLDCKELGVCILSFQVLSFVGLAYQEGKDIVFRFIREYSSLRDLGP